MTLDELRGRIEGIRMIAEHDELAHAAEDRLREDVLRAIASADDLALVHVLAAEALTTSKIEFARWYA